ncbi:threonine synthase [Halomonas sp. CnH100-B]|jgi:threonine synthase|uniref:Threonine synthase n=1 Tax=Vreelandella aquamarina TaxID=77097 RepID=A0A857GHC6_9GAMM|nr:MULTISPECIES: threonine synthase [Halomonas]MAO62961.1 threonine synthase [Halomonas sp.]MCO7230502.1 threonine synthase [Halomonas sp. CnH100-B]MDP4557479.1 threonine synthase [Halomonas meridiana]QHD48650.1 threonine synthase [Halomonas meridiana]|tara:strand:- start:549 stop:1937 length:1389 start_codon:yes stop_codon:yes gene_type:complete
MRYISTRGQAPALSFEEVVLTGMASDGGLYVPETLPEFSKEELADMAGLSYAEIAFRVMKPFVNGEIDDETFRRLVTEAYATFNHDAVLPLKQLDASHFLLEQFHGPTLAFKDVALQLLGRLLDHFLKKRNERAVIMGATSGDTGSAAIEGCRHCDNLDIFILHPHNRVSEVQRRQMTSVLADNVFNIAIEGNFDDAQAMVKASFANQDFLNGTRLVAVNSINWARIMAQIVYYVAAGVALGAPQREVSFCVPSANFGNVFAGYMAYKMGLPVKQFIIATNANDILHRTLAANDFSKKELAATLAPSMDIVVSSNFERLLFDAYDRDGAAVAALLERFQQEPTALADAPLAKLREKFASHSVDDETILEVIREAHHRTGEILDPHTATGYRAAERARVDTSTPMITLATAHPAKFAEAVVKAGFQGVPLPTHMDDLLEREERYTVLPAELSAVQQFVADNRR